MSVVFPIASSIRNATGMIRLIYRTSDIDIYLAYLGYRTCCMFERSCLTASTFLVVVVVVSSKVLDSRYAGHATSKTKVHESKNPPSEMISPHCDHAKSSMTSLLPHTVAQPTKWRFLPKNLSQLVIFVIGLAFTWV